MRGQYLRRECGAGDTAPASWVEGFRGSACPGASGELLVLAGRASLYSCWLSGCGWLHCAFALGLSCISSFRGQAVSSWSHTSFCLCVFSNSLGMISIWGGGGRLCLEQRQRAWDASRWSLSCSHVSWLRSRVDSERKGHGHPSNNQSFGYNQEQRQLVLLT